MTTEEMKKYRKKRKIKKIVDMVLDLNEKCTKRFLTVQEIKEINGNVIESGDLDTIFYFMRFCVLADREKLRERIIKSKDPVFSYLTAKYITHYFFSIDAGFTDEVKKFDSRKRFNDFTHSYNYTSAVEYGDALGNPPSDPYYGDKIDRASILDNYFLSYYRQNLLPFDNNKLQKNVIKYGTPILCAKYARDVWDADVEELRNFVMSSNDEEAKRIFTEEVDTKVEEKCPLKDIIDKHNNKEISRKEYKKAIESIRGKIYGSDNDDEYRSQLFKSSAKVKTLK